MFLFLLIRNSQITAKVLRLKGTIVSFKKINTKYSLFTLVVPKKKKNVFFGKKPGKRLFSLFRKKGDQEDDVDDER
jgi:hypothetical protein